MKNIDEQKKFGIHKKYGVDIAQPKKKPCAYQLVEIDAQGRENLISQVYPTQYGILVRLKKERERNNNFTRYKGITLKIKPVY